MPRSFQDHIPMIRDPSQDVSPIIPIIFRFIADLVTEFQGHHSGLASPLIYISMVIKRRARLLQLQCCIQAHLFKDTKKAAKEVFNPVQTLEGDKPYKILRIQQEIMI